MNPYGITPQHAEAIEEIKRLRAALAKAEGERDAARQAQAEAAEGKGPLAFRLGQAVHEEAERRRAAESSIAALRSAVEGLAKEWEDLARCSDDLTHRPNLPDASRAGWAGRARALEESAERLRSLLSPSGAKEK